MPALVSTAEWNRLALFLQHVGTQMTALQAAIQQLQADVQALASAVTAAQANQFSAQDVQNVQALGDQVKSLVASVAPPPAPTPAPTPSAS